MYNINTGNLIYIKRTTFSRQLFSMLERNDNEEERKYFAVYDISIYTGNDSFCCRA